MKRYICILMLTASLDSFAQYSSTTIAQRVGRGADSIECINNLALFTEYMKQGEPVQAYTPWSSLIRKSPLAQLSLYTQGEKMFRSLIEAEQDSARRSSLVADMMMLYDTRLANIDQLNQLYPGRSKRGNIECRKAYFLSEYAPLSKDSAYATMQSGIQRILASDDENAEAFLLSRYFDLANYKYEQTRKVEQLLSNYIDCRICCDKALEKANLIEDSVKAAQYVAEYRTVKRSVNKAYKALSLDKKESFIADFTNNIERNSTNIEYLNSALKILSEFGFEESKAYFCAAKYAHTIRPTYESAIGMALHSTKEGNNADAVKYFNEAMQNCESNKAKSQICFRIARLYLKGGKSASALSYLDKSEAYEKNMTGKCDLIRAQIKAISKEYHAAIELCRKAKQEDVTLADGANRLIEKCNEALTAESKVKLNEAELAKKKKEEKFWNEGKK